LDAAREMLRSLDNASIALLRARIGAERDAGVRKEIETGLALAALDSGDAKLRLEGVGTLSGRLGSDVRNRLAQLLEKAPDGTFVERDEQVRKAAADAVRRIDQ